MAPITAYGGRNHQGRPSAQTCSSTESTGLCTSFRALEVTHHAQAGDSSVDLSVYAARSLGTACGLRAGVHTASPDTVVPSPRRPPAGTASHLCHRGPSTASTRPMTTDDEISMRVIQAIPGMSSPCACTADGARTCQTRTVGRTGRTIPASVVAETATLAQPHGRWQCCEVQG